jgi:hypothetical protein
MGIESILYISAILLSALHLESSMKAGDFKADRIYKGILFKVSGSTN